ncbi:ricin-type beta-trefoil lectin domain protein [Streptomyces sp. NPDC001260]|uniref:RICIN domain-containing protein n=1 Tax=unclassified Streptomyces TaxID=2593676 RepID=UPI00190DA94E|nr:RICIN domain-containing protein [Streptomyces sp. MBT33]MBK3643839.1 ricin-type beta-trefoil lectin domain protein [Streptomyces sp. MBT33]
MNDAGLSNSPTSARRFEVTDEQLSAELKKWTGSSPALQPVGELLDRHWEAGFAYARLCTDGTPSAGMLTTAAFTRLFGETLRQNGPTSAWRPQLLVTVRRIAAEWDNDHRSEHLHPQLRSETDGGERVAARLLPPPHRRLLSGAFQRLPQSSRCLLWHAEVEAEPIEIPGGLLGLDAEDARVELGRARERLREECLQVHRELAPEQECRRYLRMLDVTYRRGGADVDPDLAAHLSRCRHCRYTADQLAQFNQAIGLALAEAVLGWGAQAYVESRLAGPVEGSALPEELRPRVMAGEPFFAPPGEPPAPARTVAGGGPRPGGRTASRRSDRKAARRAAARRRNLTAAVLTVSGLVVLPLVLWAVLGNGDHTTPAGGHPSETPGPAKSTPTGNPSWISASEAAQGNVQGRLHNVGSGLCVSVVGKKAVEGAETELASCSSAGTQQWRYETDGRLRSVADPELCLDSHLGYSVVLAPCTGGVQKNIRYDFTLRGALVPRWNQDLAMAPAATDGSGALVLKTREESGVQRWAFDTVKADLQMQVVNWDEDTTPVPTSTPKAPTPTPKASDKPTPSATPTTAQPAPTASSGYPTNPYCYYNPYYCGGGGYGGGNGGGYGGGGYGGGGYGGGRH